MRHLVQFHLRGLVWLTATVACFLSGYWFRWESAEIAASSRNLSSPRLVIASAKTDFGSMKLGELGKGHLDFRNAGHVPLRIKWAGGGSM